MKLLSKNRATGEFIITGEFGLWTLSLPVTLTYFFDFEEEEGPSEFYPGYPGGVVIEDYREIEWDTELYSEEENKFIRDNIVDILDTIEAETTLLINKMKRDGSYYDY